MWMSGRRLRNMIFFAGRKLINKEILERKDEHVKKKKKNSCSFMSFCTGCYRGSGFGKSRCKTKICKEVHGSV